MAESSTVTPLAAPSRRERFYMHNSLIALIQALQDHYITVEMRNQTSVCGKLFSVDGFMNVNLEDAVLVTADDKQHNFEYFFVQARNIKYFTIPQHLDIAEALTMELTKNRRRFCHQGKDVSGSKRFGKKTTGLGQGRGTSFPQASTSSAPSTSQPSTSRAGQGSSSVHNPSATSEPT